MSEKRSVPTFRLHLVGRGDPLEGPVVSPNRDEVAESLQAVHQILSTHGAVQVYDSQWVYLPCHAVVEVRAGQQRFSLPWPL